MDAAALPGRSRSAVTLADDLGPMLDGFSGLANRLGEGVVLIVVTVLPVVVHLDEMSQCPPGGEELPFGVVALDFGRKRLCHGL